MIGGAPNLDMMLGDLQENMNKQGIKTKQKVQLMLHDNDLKK